VGKIWVNNHAHVLAEMENGVNLRFLYHYLHTVDITSIVTGSAQPKLNKGNMNDIAVPVPSRDDQEEIVAILDTFGARVGDLSAMLPAEREARRKQYAYYRDRLLAFEEAA
jgi:type I restriction enzyme S subunit